MQNIEGLKNLLYSLVGFEPLAAAEIGQNKSPKKKEPRQIFQGRYMREGVSWPSMLTFEYAMPLLRCAYAEDEPVTIE